MEQQIGNSEWLNADGLMLKDTCPCDSENCEREAKYWMRKKCCGSIMIVCHDCIEATYQFNLVMAFKNEKITCTDCSEQVTVRNWLSNPRRL